MPIIIHSADCTELYQCLIDVQNICLFSAEKGEGGEAREHERHLQRSDRICHGTAKGKTAKKHFFFWKGI